jgi:predicted histone-like DNA-binding protein
MGTYVLKEMAKGMGKGDSALYPKLQIYNMFENDKVVKYIHEYSPAFSEGVIRGVLDALAHTMKSVLPMGHSMKIDGLGVFSLSLGFDEDSEDGLIVDDETGEVKQKEKYRHVCANNINFKVDPKLIEGINKESTFERNPVGVKRIKKVNSTIEQRKNKALQVIEKQGFITLDEYANENGLSRSSASRELSRLTADPTSGIKEKGSGSHKVWICSKLG